LIVSDVKYVVTSIPVNHVQQIQLHLPGILKIKSLKGSLVVMKFH